MPQTAPIIIGGCPRSGTTLVRALLGAHSRIAAGPELKLLGMVCDQMDDLYTAYGDRLFWYGIDRTKFIASCARLVDDWLRPFVAEQGKARWCEKTPTNVRWFAGLARLFPDAKLVHVVRQPLDVVASLQHQAWVYCDGTPIEYTNDPMAAADEWCFAMQAANGAYHYRLHYENLCRQPEAELRALCDWLGEDFEPAMLVGHRRASDELPEDERKSHQGRLNEPIDESAIGRGNRELSPEVAAQVLTRCRLTSVASGYVLRG